MEKLLRLFVVTCFIGASLGTVTYPSLMWDPRNPIFKNGASLSVLTMSKINFLCPNAALIPAKTLLNIGLHQMYENIWVVDKASFDSCTVDLSRKFPYQRILECNTPLTLKCHLMVFQQFSATGGLEFQPGKEYYFIATSDGSKASLKLGSGGHCSSHNMKIAIYVCTGSSDPKCQPVVPTTQTPLTCPTQAPITTAPTTIPPTTIPATTTSPPPVLQCVGLSDIQAITNQTNILPSIHQETSKIPLIMAALQTLTEQLDEVRDKLDNCSSPSTTPASTSAPATLPTTKPVLKNCKEHYLAGEKTSGVYRIAPDGLGEFEVYCDQTTDGGGWAVFQKRFDGTVDFYRTWKDYKSGFGTLTGEFWLGLDKIHRLAVTPVTLRVDLTAADGEKRFAKYTGFKIGDSASKYKLTSGTYSGTAGDSLAFTNGGKFTTFDQDNDTWDGKNCATLFKGAWWHKMCHEADLNGVYRNGSHPGDFADGIIWRTWKGYEYSFSRSEMKIKL